VAGTVAVANALAYGWSSDFLMPRVALASPSIAAPMFFDMASGSVARPMPMAAPSPERLSASRQAPGADGGAPGDLAGLAGAPFEVARGLVSRLRGQRKSPASGSSVEAMGGPGHAARYAGRPDLGSGAAILFDSGTVPTWVAGVQRFTRLSVRIAGQGGGAPLDSGITLELFVDDLTAPRARVRLADIVRQGGERPLNVQYRQGQVVRLVLRDPNAAWRAGAPELLVELH
jgi:Ca-activated chloride channel family protein